ncbi:MAG: 1,4-dihydroxy-2-naphthoate polyprenyltransferase [Cytophagaceae bacterium]|nr:1,4-dihydroxy-2-naphthoate polyprenyltransferase [Cytophagaceae bacterium]
MTPTFKVWLKAFRLRTLFLALACIFMGSSLAAVDHKFSMLIFILSCLTAIFLQILSNLANDYGDYVHGADSVYRVGPKRAVQAGEISASAMKRAIYLFVFLSLVTGLYLLYVGIHFSPLNFFGFFLLGILAIIAAIKYTAGSKPYGYAGLGDIAVFIFFGWVGVMGTYYLQAGALKSELFLPATSCGLFSVGVLNINNIRDIESDSMAGKKSIPVRIGRHKAKIYHWLLLFAGVIFTFIYTIVNYIHPSQFVFLLSLPMFIKNGAMIWKISDPQKLNPYLKQMAISTLIFVITFGAGLLLATFAF